MFFSLLILFLQNIHETFVLLCFFSSAKIKKIRKIKYKHTLKMQFIKSMRLWYNMKFTLLIATIVPPLWQI